MADNDMTGFEIWLSAQDHARQYRSQSWPGRNDMLQAFYAGAAYFHVQKQAREGIAGDTAFHEVVNGLGKVVASGLSETDALEYAAQYDRRNQNSVKSGAKTRPVPA